MFFANLKKKAQDATSKFSGKKDFLEAVCAASALVASCDGNVSDDELKAAIGAVGAVPALTNGFKTAVIETTMDAMLKRAASGKLGRNGLFKEIDDVKASHDMAEAVYLAAWDIANADGEIGPKEQETLTAIAKRLSLNPANYANV